MIGVDGGVVVVGVVAISVFINYLHTENRI